MKSETTQEEGRTARIPVNMTASEKAEITTAAQARGYSASVFMRSVALERARAK